MNTNKSVAQYIDEKSKIQKYNASYPKNTSENNIKIGIGLDYLREYVSMNVSAWLHIDSVDELERAIQTTLFDNVVDCTIYLGKLNL